MRIYYSILFLGCLFLIYSCNSKQRGQQQESSSDSAKIEVDEMPHLSDLETGEVFYKSKDPFGETIELQGKQIEADTVIFRVSGTEMLVRDNILLMKNRGSLMLFELPDFKFLGYRGTYGQGPNELASPHLVSTQDDNDLFYVFESTKQTLFKIDDKNEFIPYPFAFNKSAQPTYSDKQLVNVSPNDFLYVETTSKGKSIFRTVNDGDSVVTREVFNLALNPNRKSWVAYIGDFAANPKQNRMVYAYKYFKMIKFMDMDAKSIRTVNFERDTFDDTSPYRMDGMDSNITHYWGVASQDNYVYFLYSGRTPMEVGREASKGNRYIYVEQYDWNGTPIHKYKLDQWGYFTVDEKNKKIYLASTNHDDPFFIYDLP